MRPIDDVQTRPEEKSAARRSLEVDRWRDIKRFGSMWSALALAGLIGSSLVMADDAYLTGAGDGYYPGFGVGQGAYPSAYVNGIKDGYDFCASTRRISRGSIFSVCWLQYVPSPSLAGQAEGHVAGQVAGRERMYLAQRAVPINAWRPDRQR